MKRFLGDDMGGNATTYFLTTFLLQHGIDQERVILRFYLTKRNKALYKCKSL